MATVGFFILALAGPGLAQTVEPSIGVGFVGLNSAHLAVVGTVRVHVTRSLSIDPEILYLRGHNNTFTRSTALQAGPNLAYTFHRGAVAPYAVVGAHFGRVRRTFNCEMRCMGPDSLSTSFSWTSGSAGGGIRFHPSQGWFLSPEFRLIGDKDGAYVRFAVHVGVTLGGSENP